MHFLALLPCETIAPLQHCPFVLPHQSRKALQGLSGPLHILALLPCETTPPPECHPAVRPNPVRKPHREKLGPLRFLVPLPCESTLLTERSLAKLRDPGSTEIPD